MRKSKRKSGPAGVSLEHRDRPHLQDEVGGGKAELWWSAREDEDERDPLIAAALRVIDEVEVGAGTGAAEDAEAVTRELFVVKRNIEVEVPSSHTVTLVGHCLFDLPTPIGIAESL